MHGTGFADCAAMRAHTLVPELGLQLQQSFGEALTANVNALRDSEHCSTTCTYETQDIQQCGS